MMLKVCPKLSISAVALNGRSQGHQSVELKQTLGWTQEWNTSKSQAIIALHMQSMMLRKVFCKNMKRLQDSEDKKSSDAII